MGIGKDKRYFDREFKYEAIRLMNEGNHCYRGCLDCSQRLGLGFLIGVSSM
jgi:hypothetical protein